jgi:hypothetical protein
MRNAAAATALAVASAFAAMPAAAQEAFDACTVFTQQEAEAALGTKAEPEPVNPKVKRPKVVLACAYHGNKEGKPVSATAQFKFARTPEEQARAFDEARLQLMTKPMILGRQGGTDARAQGQGLGHPDRGSRCGARARARQREEARRGPRQEALMS